MSMKKKPDLSSFQQGEKDPSAFLDGASADQAEQPSKPSKNKEWKAPPRVQKIFRFRPELVNALMMHVAQQSMEQNRRVSEQEIVEQLLTDYLRLHGAKV